MTLKSSLFIGAWSLVDWRIEYSNGRITRPFGDGAKGQILYSADGQMSATVSADARKVMSHGNVRDASPEDKAAAFDSYFHYAGKWYIDGDFVVHTVTLALNPAFVGTQQRRLAQFQDKRLVLSAHEDMGKSLTRHHILEWKKGHKA